jgi:osmotically-inducible protein OsmY
MVSLANEMVRFSDRDLEQYVTSRLMSRNVAALRQIDVRVESGKVTLRGTVASFYQKQLCIHACRSVPGVVALVDEVEVAPVT